MKIVEKQIAHLGSQSTFLFSKRPTIHIDNIFIPKGIFLFYFMDNWAVSLAALLYIQLISGVNRTVQDKLNAGAVAGGCQQGSVGLNIRPDRILL